MSGLPCPVCRAALRPVREGLLGVTSAPLGIICRACGYLPGVTGQAAGGALLRPSRRSFISLMGAALAGAALGPSRVDAQPAMLLGRPIRLIVTPTLIMDNDAQARWVPEFGNFDSYISRLQFGRVTMVQGESNGFTITEKRSSHHRVGNDSLVRLGDIADIRYEQGSKVVSLNVVCDGQRRPRALQGEDRHEDVPAVPRLRTRDEGLDD